MTHLDLDLSAYLDGELAQGDLVRVESHLAGCAECRTALEELRQLVRRASALDDTPPERDLWPGIADRIATASTADVLPLDARRRRVSFSVPQLAAAAVAIVALSATVTTMAVRGPDVPAAPAPRDAAPAVFPASPAVQPAEQAVESYDAAIREMQGLLALRRGDLDTATVRVIEQSLRLIDIAIAQARAALRRDPNDPYLNGHLQRALDRKLDVLRQAVTLPVVS